MFIAPIDIFKESWQIYKANYKAFFKILLWPFITLLLITVLNLVDSITQLKYINFTFPLYLVLLALSFVIGIWANIVLIRLVWSSLTHETVDQKNLNENAWRDTVPYLWVSFLVGIIVVLGTLLFIIPGIIFTVWFVLSNLVFVIEGTRGYKALQRSRELIEGRFWPVVWRLAVPNLMILAIVIIIIGIPTWVVGMLTDFTGFNRLTGQSPWWSNLLNSIGSLIIIPMTLSFSVLIYKSLKETFTEKLEKIA